MRTERQVCVRERPLTLQPMETMLNLHWKEPLQSNTVFCLNVGRVFSCVVSVACCAFATHDTPSLHNNNSEHDNLPKVCVAKHLL